MEGKQIELDTGYRLGGGEGDGLDRRLDYSLSLTVLP